LSQTLLMPFKLIYFPLKVFQLFFSKNFFDLPERTFHRCINFRNKCFLQRHNLCMNVQNNCIEFRPLRFVELYSFRHMMQYSLRGPVGNAVNTLMRHDHSGMHAEKCSRNCGKGNSRYQVYWFHCMSPVNHLLVHG
jgi:hypothetical protein